jgi:hypothetical protein
VSDRSSAVDEELGVEALALQEHRRVAQQAVLDPDQPPPQRPADEVDALRLGVAVGEAVAGLGAEHVRRDAEQLRDAQVVERLVSMNWASSSGIDTDCQSCPPRGRRCRRRCVARRARFFQSFGAARRLPG